DRALHAAGDGCGLERGPQVRAVVPGRADGARRPRRGRHRAAVGRAAGPRRPGPDAGGGGGDRGGHPARRDRVPVRVGRQHHPPGGGGVRPLRAHLVRPAGHRAGDPAGGGLGRAAGQGGRAGCGAAGPGPGAPRHAAGRPYARHPRRAGRLRAPAGRLRVRGRPVPGPAARRPRGRRGGEDQRRGGDVLVGGPGAGGLGRRGPRPDPGRRRDPGGAAGRDRRVGVGAGDPGHRVRGGRAGGPARAAHRGAGDLGAVPEGAEGLQRDAAQEEPDHVGADRGAGPDRPRLRHAGHRGHPAVARAGHLAFLRRAHRAAGRRDRHRLPAAPDPPAGGGDGGGRRPDAGQPRLHRRARLHLRGAAGPGPLRAVPGGRVRADAGGGDGDLGGRRAVPPDAAGAGRRAGGRAGRGRAGRGDAPGAVRRAAGPGLRPGGRPQL
ncbi:MAG: Adenylosuccinate lyase @ SAICAR lyase, partial [uncultured Corynebacteriales bacterium]